MKLTMTSVRNMIVSPDGVMVNASVGISEAPGGSDRPCAQGKDTPEATGLTMLKILVRFQVWAIEFCFFRCEVGVSQNDALIWSQPLDLLQRKEERRS